MSTLREAWEEHAAAWLAWARTPGHDVDFWEHNWPAFERLLPAAGHRTLDLGCGEGRVGRLLAERGHRVTGVDASPTLARLALDAGGYEEVLEADAAALPLPGAAFDLVVAFMSLQDIDDLPGALSEAARVLEPDGRLCLATVHPETSAIYGGGGDPAAERRYVERIERDGLTMEFHAVHRPLEHWWRALGEAGFAVDAIAEPERAPRPLFLHVLARLAPR